MNDRIHQILRGAEAVPPDRRSAYLDEATADDPALRKEVESLLALQSSLRSGVAETMDPSSAKKRGDTVLEPAPTSKSEHRQIGPYKLLEILGEGGFGTVWVAEQQAPIRRRVALKIVKAGMDSRAVVARFEQERQALAIMNHPNIAKVFDAGMSPDNRPYFVMEYVAGEPITLFCDKARLNIQKRLELFIPVCEAVQHAHHKGIIHRDIKPGNVLVTDAPGTGPVVKVIDFGVAKALSQSLTDKTIFTEQGMILGTPEYMSPEQAEMGAVDIDTRTDVYSLGVMLYEMLAGVLPFEPRELRSKGYQEIQRIIREVDPPRPSTRLRSLAGEQSGDVARRRQIKMEELEGQLRRELEWIPLKAMRKERAERYATPIAIADDIRNHLAGRPLTAGPESAWYRARKFLRRNRAGVITVSVVCLALLAGGIAATIGFVQASRNAKLAREENAKLRQVVAFTTDMLSVPNPASGKPSGATIKEILDESVVELDAGALNGRPEIEAAVRNILGRTYGQISETDKSETQWRKALELESATRGRESVEATVAMSSIGKALMEKRQLDEADKILDDSLKIQRRILPTDHADIADTINVQGMVAYARGDLPAAAARYREAMEIYISNPGVGTRMADAMSNLAGVLHQTNKTPEALELARKALQIRRGKYGHDSYEAWNSLANIMVLEQGSGDLVAAEKTGREALAIARKRFDDKNRSLATTLTNLGQVLWLRGGDSLNEAKTTYLEALEISKKIDGEQSPGVAKSLDMLACISRDQGDLPKAGTLFRQELAISRAIQPEGHPDIATAMSQLADALTRANQSNSEAIELATKALEIRKKIYPPGTWVIWSTTSVLGGAMTGAGKFDEAEKLLNEAYQGLESVVPGRKKALAEAADRLAIHYEKRGNADQAAKWRQKRDAHSSVAPAR